MGQQFNSRDRFLCEDTFGNREHMDAETTGVDEITQAGAVGVVRVSRLAP